MTAEPFLLASGDHSLQVIPRYGGSLGFWRVQREGGPVDILRPSGAAAVEAGEVGKLACFPLVPYSNRIREGRFNLAGKEVALPLNFGRHPHSIHGQGWQSPWEVAEEWPDRLVIDYRHDADAWPWPYTARQEIALAPDGLSVELSLTNLSDRPMPAGLGLHPYFAGAREARLSAEVSGVWQVDAEIMPTELTPLPDRWNLPRGRAVAGLSCDNVFTGWAGRTRIERPDAGLAIELSSGPPLEFLVVFAPSGEDYFCVEPVSHATDAFNRAAAGEAGTGTRLLARGTTMTARIEMTVTTL